MYRKFVIAISTSELWGVKFEALKSSPQAPILFSVWLSDVDGVLSKSFSIVAPLPGQTQGPPPPGGTPSTGHPVTIRGFRNNLKIYFDHQGQGHGGSEAKHPAAGRRPRYFFSDSKQYHRMIELIKNTTSAPPAVQSTHVPCGHIKPYETTTNLTDHSREAPIPSHMIQISIFG